MWEEIIWYNIAGIEIPIKVSVEAVVVFEDYSNLDLIKAPGPIEESFEFFRIDSNGNKEYVKVFNGIMTSDYYNESPDGEILFEKNRIDRIIFAQSDVSLFSSENIRKFNEYNEDSFDTYELVDGEIRLLRIEKNEVDHGNFQTLEMKVTDLVSGEILPYERILEGYQQ